MATSVLRSSPDCWLLGKPVDFLSSARLPSKQDAMSLFLFHHVVEKKSVAEELNMSQGPQRMGEGQDPDTAGGCLLQETSTNPR